MYAFQNAIKTAEVNQYRFSNCLKDPKAFSDSTYSGLNRFHIIDGSHRVDASVSYFDKIAQNINTANVIRHKNAILKHNAFGSPSVR